MPIFFMFGKYSMEGMKGISPKRTEEVVKVVKKYKGEVKEMYALLGKKDLVFIVNFPGTDQAIQASVALSKMTGIGFTTCPAVMVEEFDKLTAGI